MAAKRLTAAEKRERDSLEAERYGKTFLRRMAEASSFADLWKLANNTRPAGLSDRYHHWLGCALHDNPYDSAPREVADAIAAAVRRVKES